MQTIHLQTVSRALLCVPCIRLQQNAHRLYQDRPTLSEHRHSLVVASGTYLLSVALTEERSFLSIPTHLLSGTTVWVAFVNNQDKGHR
jgi:hypothetical protein